MLQDQANRSALDVGPAWATMYGDCEQYTHKYSTYRVLHCMITFYRANTRGSRAAKLKKNCHPRVMSRSLPHLTLTTSTLSPISSTSPIFPTVSPLHSSPMILDPCIPCDVPHQSGDQHQSHKMLDVKLVSGAERTRESCCIVSIQKRRTRKPIQEFCFQKR